MFKPPIVFLLTIPLRKHAYSNILRILPPKNENFQMKNSSSFHISAKNIDCGSLLEPPRRGDSNEYPESMFLRRNKKINVYPCKPQLYCIKVGFKEVKTIYRRVIVMPRRFVCCSSLFVRLWFHMCRLFCPYLLLIFPSWVPLEGSAPCLCHFLCIFIYICTCMETKISLRIHTIHDQSLRNPRNFAPPDCPKCTSEDCDKTGRTSPKVRYLMWWITFV